MQRRFVSMPVKIRRVKTKDPERRLTRIGTGTLSGLAVERWREVNPPGIRVEQKLFRIKSVPGIRAIVVGAVDPVGVVTGAMEIGLFQPAMPNPFCLVTQRF